MNRVVAALSLTAAFAAGCGVAVAREMLGKLFTRKTVRGDAEPVMDDAVTDQSTDRSTDHADADRPVGDTAAWPPPIPDRPSVRIFTSNPSL